MRPWFAFVKLFLVAFLIASAFGQNSSAQNQSAPASAETSATTATAAPEADTDSADIPAIARDRISEEDYFALRDQQIGMQRGIGDLVRDPLLRSKAIRTMELQEFFLRRLHEGGASLGALAPAATNTWTPLGPAPIPNGQTDPLLNPANEEPVSGRVTTIAIDPADATANTVYVGTAQGGLYRTLDGGTTWTPLMDSQPSLAIGALAIDPIDHTTLFVGSGEGNNSGDSFFGVGLFIIRNATTTADVSGPFNLSATGGDIFTGRSITQILISPADDNKILVSTGSGFSGLSFDTFSVLPARGVYLSLNAMGPAPTFAQQAAPNVTNHIVSDMVMDPGNPAKVLVHVVGAAGATDGGIWESTAGDPFAGTATWTQTFGEASGIVGKFAVNRVGTTTTFALAASDSLPCPTPTSAPKAGTLRTSLDGLTWTAVSGATGFCGGQCVYDAPVALDPANAKNIYIGGNADSTTGSALACGSAALAKATDGASFNRSDTRLHADSHAIAIATSNSSIIYMGNDGGIFRSTNAGLTWSSLNNSSFSATQFQSLALHPGDANFMIGGTQDNGTEFMNSAGTWTRADAGDGGYALIDQSSVGLTNVTMYHTFFNQTGATNGIIGFDRVTLTADANDSGWSFFGCPATAGQITANGISCTDQVLFYAPMALGPGSPNTLYFGTDHLYRSADQGATMTSVSQASFAVNATTSLNVPVSAIGISPQNDQVRIVGLTNGQVFATTTGANPIPAVTGPWGAHYVARAVVDPTNSNTSYVTLDGYGFASHVWKTTNLNAASPTWVAASGALPDVPVNAFAIDPVFPNNLFAGTDVGVFSSTDGGTTWTPYGTGLPRVAVFDMAINKVTRKLRIATHGKGIWEIAVINPAGSVALAASGTSVQTGTAVTLTATVAQGSSLPVPTGTITFSDGASALGNPVVLDGTGTATLQASALGNGTHSITAGYSGDVNYAAGTSSAVVIDVGPADYAVTVPNGAATVNAGQSATFTINITPQHGFSSAVAFSCSGLPAGASCAFNPASVTANGAAASSTLTITTTSRLVASAGPASNNLGMFLASGSLFGIGLVLCGFGKKRRWQPVCLMLIVAGVLFGLVACGGSNSTPNPQPNTGTPAGTFTVVVTATSGSTSHQSNITLTVR